MKFYIALSFDNCDYFTIIMTMSIIFTNNRFEKFRMLSILILTMIVVINAWFRPKKDEPPARLFLMLIIISNLKLRLTISWRVLPEPDRLVSSRLQI